MKQNYSADVIQNIVDQYALGKVERFFLFTSGYENSNYYIETKSGKFVLKFFEGQGVSAENIFFEIEVMAVCYRAGIKSPNILKTQDGGLYSLWNGKVIIIMEYIDGENMDERQISDKIAVEIGKESGRMDNALKVFQNGEKTRQNYEWDLKNFLSLEPKIEYLGKDIDHKQIGKIFHDFRSIKPVFDSLPKGLIHNDIVLHNILVKDETLKGIIDFSDMAFSPYIQNLSVSMAQIFFCCNWSPPQAMLFIKGYREHHPISSAELRLLYDLTCARFAMLVIEFNYWNKKLFGHDDQREKAVRDFHQYMVKFIQLGRKNFNDLIQI